MLRRVVGTVGGGVVGAQACLLVLELAGGVVAGAPEDIRWTTASGEATYRPASPVPSAR